MTIRADVEKWVAGAERLTRPKSVHWCDGSEEENKRLIGGMVSDGSLIPLNASKHPGSFLHRSHPGDVARTERQTFVCPEEQHDAGPTNNWMNPREAKEKVGKLFDGAMRDRTMYVIPYIMGPAGSPHSRLGVEITDSPYVVVNMRIMTRMGRIATDRMATSTEFCAGLHSIGDLDPSRRFILHFPHERLIWSIGSGYGGNALLGKKCFALRIASAMARGQGWLAEHMLILGLQDPSGEITYMAAAFPSACGKTNLAMLVSPLTERGYKVWTVGDDIAWMRPGPDGRLWAVNPEAGFFGVAPGTSAETNANALATTRQNSIFTNTALTPDGCPWWEGLDTGPPAGTVDWQGRPFEPGNGKNAAHPNARFTAPASQCPSISAKWEEPAGVPISAILFGGRRRRVMPLVCQAFDWTHGVYMGASMGSETTAAAEGKTGLVRRDPMAMLPFCGYNMADYFAHWLGMQDKLTRPPQIYSVNWFRRDDAGRFLWPGFGQNVRVLAWILDRVRGSGAACESAVGWIPAKDAIDWDGLKMPPESYDALFEIDREIWVNEMAEQRHFFDSFGGRMPEPVRRAHAEQMRRLKIQDANRD